MRLRISLLLLCIASPAVAGESDGMLQDRGLKARPSGGSRQGEPVVLLYKGADSASALRTDEGMDSATRILENALSAEGYRVTQPNAGVQAILDKGPNTIVTFAPDAGLSVLLSGKQRELPIPGDPNRIQAEISLNARVYCGSILQPSPPEAQGKVTALRTSLGKGYDFAARRAASKLAEALRVDLARRETACMGALDRMVQDYRSNEPDPVSTLPSGPLPKPKRVWALLAGVADFTQVRNTTGIDIHDLKGVRADMELMRGTLMARGVPDTNIVYLFNEQATSGNFRQHLRDMQIKAGPDDLVLVYIATHGKAADLREGTPDNPSISGYGVPVFHDFDPSPNPAKRASIVDFWEIQSLLLNTRVKQIVWLVDTCHAGGAASGLAQTYAGSRPIERIQLGARGMQVIDPANAVFNPHQAAEIAGQVSSTRNFIVLSAATPEQQALETENGLFTLSLTQGLKKNRVPISLEQLFRDSVEKQVLKASNGNQHPVMGKSGRGGEIKL